MKKIILILHFIFTFSAIIIAQSATITGNVIADEISLPFATIAIQGTSIGSTSNEKGEFELLNIENGNYVLVVSNMGYKSYFKEIEIKNNESINVGEIELNEDIFGLNEVVVTGTMKETYIANSPIKVDIITSKYLEKTTSPTNIVEAISMVNGVQEVVACGVCFTNNISINGLPGPYTAILIDGAPMFGNLASVYGLNGIPTTVIDRFEVIKGPSSTLYGSEAVAGVINIITKKPEDQPLFAIDLMATSHLESFGNLSFSPKIGKYNGTIGLNYAYINDFDDTNDDGFGDVVNLDRVSFFTKWSKDRSDKKATTIAAKIYYEDRRNGVEEYIEDRGYQKLRGDDEIYGESIYTNRVEVFGKHDLPTSENLSLTYSYSFHDQDSYYGADQYLAKQHIGFSNFVWNKMLGSHDVLGGATLRYQNYDDNTVATSKIVDGETVNITDNQFIPGVFLQDEWELGKKITALYGGRLDHYSEHGLIFAPRFNLKYKPEPWTTFRLNFGTGFRIVNLFTEDHAFITGNRTVEILEDLNPERSYNGSFNFNHIFNIKNAQGSIDFDAYYTYFENAIFPNYDDPEKIIYENSNGHAITKGINVSLTQQFSIPLSFNIGVNIQRAFEVDEDEDGNRVEADLEFAPRWSGVGTLTYNLKKYNVEFAYTLKVTGTMALPEVYDLDENGEPLSEPRPVESESFAFQNLQINKSFKRYKNVQLYLGIQNLFNYKQNVSPLVGYNDPTTPSGFSPFFDTAYAYAPIHGREMYLGVKWNFK